MGWFEFATTIMIISLFLNAGLFSFGFVDYQEANLVWLVVDGTADPALNRDLNTTVDPSFYQGNVEDTNNQAAASGAVDVIPYFENLITVVPIALLSFVSFPMWITYAMVISQIPTPIVLFIGFPLIFVQYLTVFYFIRQIVAAFRGGG